MTENKLRGGQNPVSGEYRLEEAGKFRERSVWSRKPNFSTQRSRPGLTVKHVIMHQQHHI
jgi:uncharacterized damage-inducible protein DinB